MDPDEPPDSSRSTADPNVVVADTAALAANSAERAQAAAADAITNAQTAAAGVAVVAAEETRQSEERLAQWQTSIVQQNEALAESLRAQSAATEAKLAEAMDAILSIRTRLDKPPESPASRESGSSGETPPPGEETPPGETEPPAEPKPARKRAHRWI
jgi:hypothetical protein